MRKLQIENTRVTATPLGPPPAVDGRVTAQKDRVGKVCAYTYTVDGEHRVDLPDLASFSFTPAGRNVTALPAPAARHDWIVDAYRRTVLPLVLQAQGQEVLHASAVLVRDRVFGVCGRSGMGKSTIAFGLGERGCRIWADDALALSLANDAVLAIPLPFKVRLKGESAWRFGARPAAENGLAILDVGGPRLQPSPVGALVMLERDGNRVTEPRVELRRLSPGEGLAALLSHAFSFSEHDEEVHRRMALHYLEVAARVPILELRIPSALERLDEVLDKLQGVTQLADGDVDG